MAIARKKRAKKEEAVTTELEKPTAIKPKTTPFKDKELLEKVAGKHTEEVVSIIGKFQNKLGVKLNWVPKFNAFKVMRDGKMVDWITLNDLTKHYKCRMPRVEMPITPQRPQENKRVY